MIRVDNCIAMFPTGSATDNPKTADAKPAKRKRNTKHIGIVSELVAMERFAGAGFLMCVPFGDCAPYDIILDDRRGSIFKIQVKTGRLRKGVVRFSCCSWHSHRKQPPTQYTGMIDAFGVYCPDNDEFYVVPIDSSAATSSFGSLRVEKPANNNSKLINWAHDYRYDENSPDALSIRAVLKAGAVGED